MTEVRNDIHFPLTERDVYNLNNTLMNLWQKLHGDVSLSDVAQDVKGQLYTNWLPVQGEGNLDSSHPLYIRFYVPPDTKKVKSASMNIITSRYRLDSDVASNNDGNISITGMTLGPSSKTSSYVDVWGNPADGISINAPISEYPDPEGLPPGAFGSGVYYDYDYNSTTGNITYAAAKSWCYPDTQFGYYAETDLYLIQHKHDISHTHEISAGGTLPEHQHPLNMGIKEASTDPSNIRLYINDVQAGSSMSGTGTVQNGIDISGSINIGAWNVLKVTSDNIARVTLYGILELTAQYK